MAARSGLRQVVDAVVQRFESDRGETWRSPAVFVTIAGGSAVLWGLILKAILVLAG
jgi:hypothetical protein